MSNHWEPISTAPKDGTPILVCDSKSETPYICEFKEHLNCWIGADRRCWEPEHWQELPKPNHDFPPYDFSTGQRTYTDPSTLPRRKVPIA